MIEPKENYNHFLWGLIHTLSICNVGNKEICRKIHLDTIAKLNHLSYLISCKKCAEHFVSELEKAKLISLEEPLALFDWSVDFHNQINQKIGKPLISRETALGLWTK